MASNRTSALRAFIESNRALPLGRYLRNVAGASALGLLGACTTSVSGWPEHVSGFVAVSCTGDPHPANWLVEDLDTANEALLAAKTAGFEIACDNASRWAVREMQGGFEVVATKQMGPPGGCGGLFELRRFLLFVDTQGTVTILDEELLERHQDDSCAIGRRPPGLLSRASATNESLAEFFANVAHLEAASVEAFEMLARELTTHGAPGALVLAARRSRAEEVRHAELMGALSRRFGAVPREVAIEKRSPRPLFEVALDNAVEGCVRETFGALVATHQAMAARDEEVRRAMIEIAEDETRHAALSWQIAGWAEPRLSPAERATVDGARRDAVSALRIESRIGPADDVASMAGMPSATGASEMVDTLASELWTERG
jgi:hypothetical protein